MCGNLILLRNRFYGYSFLLFHLHFTICIFLLTYFS
nr:MAG TPA: NUC130/3NT domain protein [Caudoviricetes sp.]